VRIWAPWNVRIGHNVTIGGGVEIYAVGKITIGDNTIVSQRAYLCGASHDVSSPTFDLMIGDIKIGNNVWIAAEAFIGPGVTIGDNAIVAARSVVARDVAPWTIVAGNPARVVGERAKTGQNHIKRVYF
jgi:putative colanic acid biosynthesis acetyltransferase WcaF